MTSDDLVIIATAGLVGTACALLGPFLILRRAALISDAISHAVLPGIVVTWLLTGTRAPLLMVFGGAVFAVLCVLAIDALRSSGLVRTNAAIGLVFPLLFAVGVLGITTFASDIHLDLDSTIYGEIAFAPLDVWTLGTTDVPRSLIVSAVVVVLNAAFVVMLWKELRAATFDPQFAATVRLRPTLLSRALLVAVAVTAVVAFEAVGAILVITLFIVPAAAAFLLTDRLGAMLAISIVIAWIAAVVGHTGALATDSSIAGSVGLTCAACFGLALLASPRHGVIATTIRRRARRRAVLGALASRHGAPDAVHLP